MGLISPVATINNKGCIVAWSIDGQKRCSLARANSRYLVVKCDRLYIDCDGWWRVPSSGNNKASVACVFVPFIHIGLFPFLPPLHFESNTFIWSIYQQRAEQWIGGGCGRGLIDGGARARERPLTTATARSNYTRLIESNNLHSDWGLIVVLSAVLFNSYRVPTISDNGAFQSHRTDSVHSPETTPSHQHKKPIFKRVLLTDTYLAHIHTYTPRNHILTTWFTIFLLINMYLRLNKALEKILEFSLKNYKGLN